MILSMTGFGRGSASSDARRITVEIKSLNSKQLDLSARVPSYLREKEIELRNMIASALLRGKIDLSIQVENLVSEATAELNIDVLQAYKEQIIRASEVIGISEPHEWYPTLLRFPDTLHTPTTHLTEKDSIALFQACKDAIDALTTYRTEEGRKLEDFFSTRISAIESLLCEIEPFETERIPKIRQRLEEQLQKISIIEFDKGRLEQELIFYIEKLDVNEEKQRLASHLQYFRNTLESACGQGKKLGFIAQEIGREINTLGSKSNNVDMQRIVVRMKDELEQIKEQVLNVL